MCFYFHYFRRWIQKILLWFISEHVLPLFSSKSFIVSGLIFKSLTHLSLFLCMVLENVQISFFYIKLCSFPSTSYWRHCLPVICLLYFYPLIYIFFLCQYHTVMMTVASDCVVWSQGLWFLPLHFSFSGLLWPSTI